MEQQIQYEKTKRLTTVDDDNNDDAVYETTVHDQKLFDN